MSTYTTQLRFICEEAAGLKESEGYNSIDDILAAAIPKVFDFDFPIWDTSYRNTLLKKICMEYYTSEICAETVGRWKLWVRATLNNVMPYYNKLYELTLKEFVPEYQMDYTKTGSDDSAGNEANTGTQKTDGTNTGTQRTQGTNTGTQKTDGTNTGTQKTDGTNTGTQSTEGKASGSSSGSRRNTGTVQDAGTADELKISSGSNTGTVGNVENGSTTRTPALKTTTRQSDTPQGGLNGIESNNYLSSAQIVDATGNEQTSGNTSSTRTDNLAHSDREEIDRSDSRTRTDDLSETTTGMEDGESSSTRTDNLKSSSTRTDDLKSSTTRTDNLASSSTRTDDLKNSSIRTDNLNKRIENTREYSERIFGHNNAYQQIDAIEKLREMIDNIDLMIIKDLEPCFMMIF